MGTPFRTLPSSRRPRRRWRPWFILGAALLLGAGAALAIASCQGDDGESEGSLPPLTEAPTTTVANATTTTLAQFYEVQQGDTLFAIASRFGVDIQALIQLNGIANPDAIQAGQKLQIPPPTVLVTGTTVAGTTVAP